MRWTLVLAAMMAVGCDGGEDGSDATDGTDADTQDDAIVGDIAAGETVYGENCATCHQADGMGGGNFPDLTLFVPDNDADAVENLVRNGGRGMPSYDATFDDQQVADVVAYVVDAFGE